MKQNAPSEHALRVADLPQNSATTFELRPDTPVLKALAGDLGITALRKLSFQGRIVGAGAADWKLEGRLGATVVQPCVVTLEPVTTRIETQVARQYLRDYAETDAPEAEMPEDDTIEPLGRWIDPEAVMLETLALHIPLYPRSDDVALGEVVVTEPGVAPMRDEDARPFAGLASLKDQLAGKDEPE